MKSGLHRAVLGRHRGALDQRQQVALHALAADVGAGMRSERAVILSISSRKTMPFCSTVLIDFASSRPVSWSSSLSLSSCSQQLAAPPLTGMRRFLVRPPKALPKMSLRLSMPMDWRPACLEYPWSAAASRLSRRHRSRSLCRSDRLHADILRNFARVSALAFRPPGHSGPALLRAARPVPSLRCAVFRGSWWIEISTRSRMICSTSRPT